MKILSYTVRNVLRIADVDLSMDGANLVLVGGANGQGKSSALKALLMALCGKRGMEWPDVALKEGEKEGWVRVNLSGDDELHDSVGFTVELFLKRKRNGQIVDEIRVLDSTGEESPEPRTLLQQLYQMRAFDPLDFERAKPKDRDALLRDLVGLDFTPLDEERKEKYSERTRINSEGKATKAQLDAVTVPPDTPDTPVNAGELFEQLERAKAANSEVSHNLTRQKEGRARLESEREKLEAEEEKLRDRLAEIEERKPALAEEITAQEKLHAEAQAATMIDVSHLEEQIRSADQINQAVAAKQKKAELFQAVENLRKKSKSLTDRIEAIDKEKQGKLENAAWPLPGMSLDESGVLLNGLPFEQASKAERVLASVKVGMALNPKLRLLVCEDGNDLDNETMAALDNALKENDFQMLLEVVTRSEADEARCAVVFQDGSAKDPEDSADAPEPEIVS